MVFLALSLVLAPQAGAQGEQWLQYRSVTEARQMVLDIGYQYIQVFPAKPEGIKLPAFKSEQPLFLEWKTPMAASGRIWLAFDMSTGKGQYDRLHLDANANDDLTDDPPCSPYRRDSVLSYFGPIKVVFASPDGPITYHLGAELRTYSGQSICLLSPACWYEGQIAIGGVKKPCLLIDHNVNGTFNDKSPDFSKSDRIRLGTPGNTTADTETGAVGNYVELEGKLYQVEVARDGAFVKVAEAKDVPQAAVRVADNITAITVAGENGSFVRTPEKGTVKLPVGEYQTVSWAIARKDDGGAKWEMKGMLPPSTAGHFQVAQSQEASLPFGEPIYSKVRVSKSGVTYTFDQSLEGRQGERVVLTRNGSQPPPPKLHIRSRDGTYDRSISSEYG